MTIEKKDLELYKKTKKAVYEMLIMGYDNFLDKLKIAAYPTEDLKEICLNTIAYPNDLAIMEEMLKSGNEEEMSKILGIPADVIRAKINEYKKYRTWNVIINDKEMKSLAQQFEANKSAKQDGFNRV